MDNMKFIKITTNKFDELKILQTKYKSEIGEEEPTYENFLNLKRAISDENIHFFGCICNDNLVACCSISVIFSTFNYEQGGILEDFFIIKEYRHKGIAKQLIKFAYKESKISSLIVGSADCDVNMYKSLGFKILIGNMLAFEN